MNMKKITVFHGTIQKHLGSIKKNGLNDNSNSSGANWYMVSTDFASALYHASPEKNESAIVIEIELEIKEKFDGLLTHTPYLWNPHVRSESSAWFGLYKSIPPSCIKKVHKIENNLYLKQKEMGMDTCATGIDGEFSFNKDSFLNSKKDLIRKRRNK